MRQIRPWLVALLGLLALASWPASGLAQGSGTYTVGLMAGLGGSTEDDTNFDNFGFQALFTMKIDNSTLWGVRLGQLDLDSDVDAGGGELNYLTLSGEYLYTSGGFESGLYLGLGLYDLDGGPTVGDDSSLGLALGVTGEIDVSDRFSLLLELSGHYADLDQAQFFVMGHVGLGYHF